jgi:hypothetical protein
MGFGRANALADDLVSLAMEEGFERSLLELAKSHENKIGPWIEIIESEVMSALKGSLAASAGVTGDAEAVATAAQQMQIFFKAFRANLEKE